MTESADTATVLHGRVSKVEAEVVGMRSRLDGISERQVAAEQKHDRQHQAVLDAMEKVHGRIEKRTTPPIGLWLTGVGLGLTALGLAFTIAGGFLALVAYFYAAQMEEMGDHLEKIDEIVLYTNNTRFTDEDGESLREMQYAHESIGGHSPMEARMKKAEEALLHRRDEADELFLRLEDRLDQLAVDIYKHSDHTQDK